MTAQPLGQCAAKEGGRHSVQLNAVKGRSVGIGSGQILSSEQIKRDESAWEELLPEVAYAALRSRVEADPIMQQALLSTGTAILAEAKEMPMRGAR